MRDVSDFAIETLSAYARDKGEPVTAATRLDALGMDSLDTLEAVMKIEDRFGVEIDPGEFSACESVSQIIAVIEQAMAA
jgi:acyl carrier protein